uniref:Uncharacterized protein n=1 Tax=Arundo donax TaxID=35708 RepID=A0A0A9H672_ARUDO
MLQPVTSLHVQRSASNFRMTGPDHHMPILAVQLLLSG